MPLAYSLADLIVSTSIKPEAFGRVAVEAQAMQKPIIASDLGRSKKKQLLIAKVVFYLNMTTQEN